MGPESEWNTRVYWQKKHPSAGSCWCDEQRWVFLTLSGQLSLNAFCIFNYLLVIYDTLLCIGYWRWMHKWMEPIKGGAAPLLQAGFLVSFIMYVGYYPFLREYWLRLFTYYASFEGETRNRWNYGWGWMCLIASNICSQTTCVCEGYERHCKYHW